MDSGKMKVLLYGRTGAGKSTVANMLVSGNLASPKFQMGDGMAGVTSICEEVDDRGYIVTDTVGLAEETESERKDAEKLIYNYLKRTRGRYSHIILVKRAGRFDGFDAAIWTSFKKVFAGAERAFMVVVTNCGEDPKRWEKENEEKLHQVYGRNMRYAFVDFPPVRHDQRAEIFLQQDRQKSLDQLETEMRCHFHDNFRRYLTRYFEPDYTALDDLELRARATAICAVIKLLFPYSPWETFFRGLWAALSSSS